MKPLLLIAAAFSLAACETVEHADGSTTTRWDAKATTEAITTSMDAWQRIDRQSRIVGYDQFGNPIYAQ